MNNKTLLIVYLLENLAVFALTAFLCWYFNSLWGLLTLFAMNTTIKFHNKNKAGDSQ